MTTENKKRVWRGGVANVRLPEEEWNALMKLTEVSMRSAPMELRHILREYIKAHPELF